MFKWLENIIKRSIIAALDERPDLFKNTLGHAVLSKDHPNIIEIDCGQMPKAKAEAWMQKQADVFKPYSKDGYRFVFMAKSK